MARRTARRTKKADKIARQAGTASTKPSTKVRRAGKVVHDQGAAKPTPEMLNRVDYDFGPVKTEMNVTIGSAYRRRPLFHTMVKRGSAFTITELAAMTEYRSIFDRCERSPFASCLAEKHGGGRGVGPASFMNATPAVLEAKRRLALIERGLGIYLGTVRAVVLHDTPFTQIAMERFGYRRRSWIVVDEPVLRNGRPVVVDGKPQTRAVHREEIVPRSGRDREKIAAEFRVGLGLLEMSIDRLNGGAIDEIWVQPRMDGSAIIHRASVAPNGLFRMWSKRARVEAVLDTILSQNDDRLVFASPEAARDALIKAAAGRLHQLEPEELAA